MTVDQREVTSLRSALLRSAAGASAREKSDFIGRLKAISLDTLRERIRTRAISTKWKRDLAIAEIADRLQASGDGAAAPAVRTRATRPWGAWVAAVVIALCCLIIAYAGYSVWMS